MVSVLGMDNESSSRGCVGEEDWIRYFRYLQPTFKRKGNEHQFQHNVAILDKVDEAIEALEHNDIERTKESLLQRKALLLKRQKLIKLADREECHWVWCKNIWAMT